MRDWIIFARTHNVRNELIDLLVNDKVFYDITFLCKNLLGFLEQGSASFPTESADFIMSLFNVNMFVFVLLVNLHSPLETA